MKNKIDSNIPERILNEHKEIFEYLKSFVTKDFSHMELSKIFNSLISMFVASKVNKVYKFTFILSTFKYVLIKLSSLYPFLDLKFVEEDFLSWFVAT
jgi:hypothetical protein